MLIAPTDFFIYENSVRKAVFRLSGVNFVCNLFLPMLSAFNDDGYIKYKTIFYQ